MFNGGKLNQELACEIDNNQTGHAYLFSGKEAKEQAVLFSMALYCEHLDEGQPCGVCESCRKITEGIYRDVKLITPEKGQLRIDQMRKIQEEAMLKPFSAPIQVFILEGADTMNASAANSLLKILEEPPDDTYFILTTNNSDKILSTIISRCRSLHWGGGEAFDIDENEIEARLKEAGDFLGFLPQADSLKLLLYSKNYEKDKEGLTYFLLALLKVFTKRLKGEEENTVSSGLTLKAALFTERTLLLLKQNINHRLLSDVYFLRLWRMHSS